MIRTKIGMALVGVWVIAMVVGIAWARTAPRMINYQGRLADDPGRPLADGTTVDLIFSFYSDESGDTLLYLSVLQEDVVITGGIYHVLIGSGAVTPGVESTLADVFQKHVEVWLGVKVDSAPEMTPRTRFGSMPYALSIDAGALYRAAAQTPDRDGDGYFTNLIGGFDCNDLRADVHPGAVELCDGIDNQCPGDPGYGEVDEGCYACNDGLDNDGDGLADENDPGCADPFDDSELGTTLCDNGVDDDGWGDPDTADPGCTSPGDTTETDPALACDNGIDDDGWGDPDHMDLGCTDPLDLDEYDFMYECDDGIDNDFDFMIDFMDPQCYGPDDLDEGM